MLDTIAWSSLGGALTYAICIAVDEVGDPQNVGDEDFHGGMDIAGRPVQPQEPHCHQGVFEVPVQPLGPRPTTHAPRPTTWCPFCFVADAVLSPAVLPAAVAAHGKNHAYAIATSRVANVDGDKRGGGHAALPIWLISICVHLCEPVRCNVGQHTHFDAKIKAPIRRPWL